MTNTTSSHSATPDTQGYLSPVSDNPFPTVNPLVSETIAYVSNDFRIYNRFGNVYVDVYRDKLPTKHGYGHHYEHGATTRARGLHLLRLTLGKDWHILELLGAFTAQGGKNGLQYSAVQISPPAND